MTIKIVFDAVPVFRKIAEQNFEGRKALILAKLLKKCQNELDIFNTTKTELLKKYCELTEDGELKVQENGNVIVKNNDNVNLEKELTDLVNTEVDFQEKIPVSWLDNISITPNEIVLILDFIDENA